MGNLDGTDVIKPTPFDAHEQVVRGSHTHGPAGYQPADYEHQEFPKAVAHDKETGAPVIAKDADHEEQLLDAADEAKKPAKAKKS